MMDKLPGARHRAWLVVAGAALLVGLAGCSSGASNAGTLSSKAAPAADTGAAERAAAGTDKKAGRVAQAPGAVPMQVAGDRAIVYTGTMTVRVSDVDAAAARLAGMATGSGGYVGGDQRSSDGKRGSATITVRVPVDRFYGTVDEIGKLGIEQSRQISAEDVTAKLVDLTARLKTQQASVDRIRALMTQARSITDVTTLESELSRREADLESLEAQQRDLTNLTTLSTITVTLLGVDAPAAKPKQPESGFVAGLKSGWRAFTGSLRAVLTVLGAVLPFAVAIGVPVWLVLYLLRRRRPAGTPAATTPVASGTTASEGR
jgi:Domain of unknown function (DUF4349)